MSNDYIHYVGQVNDTSGMAGGMAGVSGGNKWYAVRRRCGGPRGLVPLAPVGVGARRMVTRGGLFMLVYYSLQVLGVLRPMPRRCAGGAGPREPASHAVSVHSFES